MTEVVALPAVRRHRWSDWLGLLFYGASAVGLYRGSPELLVFMLPSIAHDALTAAAFLIRPPPVRRSTRGFPRAMGYIHTFSIVVFLQVASRWHPEWVAASTNETAKLAGTYLWLVSSVLGLWPLWYLRHAFSLEPEARSLVIAGPYRLARHPIYTVYILTLTGMWLRTLSVPFLLALVAWAAFLLIRIHYEEEVLTAAFPEYEEYRRQVGAFGPKLVKPRP